MSQAALFIGVNQSGDLPELSDAVAGAERLQKVWWGKTKSSPGLGPSILLTDKDRRPVTADDVQSSVETLLRPGNVKRLFVYFAGHGVNVRMGEYWLLTDAPRRTQAAVNVRGSEHLARYCGVDHVVFFSDACRTAADSINAQNIIGTDIFPNEQYSDQEKPVDMFYSCGLGRPAYEARDVEATASDFKAIYTAVLTKALTFQAAAAVEWQSEASGEVFGYVRPRKLRDHLRTAVSEKIRELNLASLVQVPDAHISSDPDAWLSRALEDKVLSKPKRGTARARARLVASTPPSPADLAGSMVKLAIHDPGQVVDIVGPIVPAGPVAFETACGFKLRGAKLANAYGFDADVEVLGPSRDIVRVNAGAPGLVLLEFQNGCGTVLPTIPSFIASLSIDRDELVDVTYEPSTNTARWSEYERFAGQIRAVRKLVASATLAGSFRLESDDALELARRLRNLKGADPTLGLYAAYGFSDLHQSSLLKRMEEFMRQDIGGSLFDIAMLAGRLDQKQWVPGAGVLGFAPLLSQGWAVLNARQIALPAGCERLPQMLTQSLWTMFSREGVHVLRGTIFRGQR